MLGKGGKGLGKGKETEIERKEIMRAIRRLREEKAIGLDKIPGEVWKWGGKEAES